MYPAPGRTIQWGGNSGLQGYDFDPSNEFEAAQAQQRLKQLETTYGPRLHSGYTGSTGLSKFDDAGYAQMLNAQSEYRNIQNRLSGRGPMNVEGGYIQNEIHQTQPGEGYVMQNGVRTQEFSRGAGRSSSHPVQERRGGTVVGGYGGYGGGVSGKGSPASMAYFAQFLDPEEVASMARSEYLGSLETAGARDQRVRNEMESQNIAMNELRRAASAAANPNRQKLEDANYADWYYNSPQYHNAMTGQARGEAAAAGVGQVAAARRFFQPDIAAQRGAQADAASQAAYNQYVLPKQIEAQGRVEEKRLDSTAALERAITDAQWRARQAAGDDAARMAQAIITANSSALPQIADPQTGAMRDQTPFEAATNYYREQMDRFNQGAGQGLSQADIAQIAAQSGHSPAEVVAEARRRGMVVNVP